MIISYFLKEKKTVKAIGYVVDNKLFKTDK